MGLYEGLVVSIAQLVVLRSYNAPRLFGLD